MTYYKSKNELELEEARKAQNRKIRELEEENQKLKEEKQELEYLWDINEELKAENKKLKYVIDLVMEKAGIEYIRLADWDVFTNPKNKLHISDTIQIDILNHNK